jgi:hypothetical protein
MGANGYGGEARGQGKGAESSGRTGAKRRLAAPDAVRLRATLCDRTREDSLRIGLAIPERAG